MCFSMNFVKFSRTFFTEHLWVTASGILNKGVATKYGALRNTVSTKLKNKDETFGFHR